MYASFFESFCQNGFAMIFVRQFQVRICLLFLKIATRLSLTHFNFTDFLRHQFYGISETPSLYYNVNDPPEIWRRKPKFGVSPGPSYFMLVLHDFFAEISSKSRFFYGYASPHECVKSFSKF